MPIFKLDDRIDPKTSMSQQAGKLLLTLSMIVLVITAATLFFWVNSGALIDPGIKIFHIQDHYTARDGALTINVTGAVTGRPKFYKSKIEYRLNDEDWQILPQGKPRVPPPNFTIELTKDRLNPGVNCLFFNTINVKSPQAGNKACFSYDPKPLDSMLSVNWKTQPLDVQDGWWEVISTDGEYYARPTPGHEDYDRILMVTGAFPGGRRVEASFIFRGRTEKHKPYGFGILPLWGGHQDTGSYFPRRGWAYGLAWYYSDQKGVGAEIATKFADEKFNQVYSYRSYEVKQNTRYQLLTEAVPIASGHGPASHYQVRMKWWAVGEAIPESWLVIEDSAGKSLPKQDYAVALLAHRSQVEFSSLTVTPIPQIKQEEL